MARTLVRGFAPCLTAAFVVGCLVALSGCGILDRVGTSVDPADPLRSAGSGASAPFASTIGLLLKLGWLAALLGFAGTVASFFIPIIPRKAAMVSIALGIGSAILADVFREIGRPLLWVLFSAAVLALLLALWPLVGAYLKLRKTGKALIQDGDVRAGTALLAVSSRKYFKNKRTMAKELTGAPGSVIAAAQRFKVPVPKEGSQIPQAIPGN